jgi:hypothetical protein
LAIDFTFLAQYEILVPAGITIEKRESDGSSEEIHFLVKTLGYGFHRKTIVVRNIDLADEVTEVTVLVMVDPRHIVLSNYRGSYDRRFPRIDLGQGYIYEPVVSKSVDYESSSNSGVLLSGVPSALTPVLPTVATLNSINTETSASTANIVPFGLNSSSSFNAASNTSMDDDDELTEESASSRTVSGTPRASPSIELLQDEKMFSIFARDGGSQLFADVFVTNTRNKTMRMLSFTDKRVRTMLPDHTSKEEEHMPCIDDPVLQTFRCCGKFYCFII